MCLFACCTCCWACSSSPSWAWVELLTGVSFFFWLGAGFWIGPVFVMLAALWRLVDELWHKHETDVTSAWTCKIVQRCDKPERKSQKTRNWWNCYRYWENVRIPKEDEVLDLQALQLLNSSALVPAPEVSLRRRRRSSP